MDVSHETFNGIYEDDRRIIPRFSYGISPWRSWPNYTTCKPERWKNFANSLCNKKVALESPQVVSVQGYFCQTIYVSCLTSSFSL